MTRTTKIVLGIAAIAAVGLLALFAGGSKIIRQFEPQIRDQAIQYLEKRFDSKVELKSLEIEIPAFSPFRAFWTKGRGALARVHGTDVLLRHKGRTDIPPMFVLKDFRFDMDLGMLAENPRKLSRVSLDGVEITIPPKGERPDFKGKDEAEAPPEEGSNSLIVAEVLVTNAKLTILPKDKKKIPLEFLIHNARLESAGKDVAMTYDAILTNAKPPGQIHSVGHFGPWAAGEPGDTPLDGNYTFNNADLGVFKAIAGLLNSTGTFAGSLSSIQARGEARVSDFRLKRAGNPVPLATQFEVDVDGTNGNTTLKPVVAKLGNTNFTTSGAVIKHDGDSRRTISLDAVMPKGRLEDLLKLAMKGAPMMEGEISLKTKILIPPISGKVKEKLVLDGDFRVAEGKFLKSLIQDKIDELSRRAQGQPKNQEIDEVFAQMSGRFHMEDEQISFQTLSFRVPGADVSIAGDYDLGEEQLDFHGDLRLDAKVSQTQSGWKRIALKPIDPFFAKNGAGTYLRIQITGPAKSPKFGLDKGPKPNQGRNTVAEAPKSNVSSQSGK